MKTSIFFVVKHVVRIRYSNIDLKDKFVEERFETYVEAKKRISRLKEIFKGATYSDGEIEGYLVAIDRDIYLLKQYETIVDDSNINNVIRDIQITEILN